MAKKKVIPFKKNKFFLGALLLFIILGSLFYIFREAIFWKTYRSDLGFSLKHPISWQTAEEFNQVIISHGPPSFQDPGSSPYRPGFFIVRKWKVDEDHNIDRYFSDLKSSPKTIYARKITFNNYQAVRSSVSTNGKFPTEFIYVEKDGVVYEMYGAVHPYSKSWLPSALDYWTIKRMIESIHFGK